MRSKYKIGNIVKDVDVRNTEMRCNNLLGLSKTKQFRPSTSNIVGTDLSKYKIVSFNHFAVDFMSTIRVHKMPIALNRTTKDIIVSPAYGVFAVKDENVVNPEYLMLWLSRSEFDRYADFKCDSAIRGGFDWSAFCRTDFAVPPIAEQLKIVRAYHVVTDRIELLQKINQKLREVAQTVFESWFVNFEHWKDLEFQETDFGNIPVGWTFKKVGELCKSVSVRHRFNKSELIFLNTGDIEENQFLHANYTDVASMPGQAKKSIQQGDILYSEIRPVHRHYALVNFPAEDYVVSTKLMVIRATKIDTLRLFQFLTLKRTVDELQKQAESRSGTFPQITFDNISNMPILIAPSDVEDKYKWGLLKTSP